MTSIERHEARYQRRKIERENRKIERNKGHDFETVASFGALRRSFYKARKGTNWKASVQRYGCNIMRNSYNMSRKMRSHKNISKGFVEFDICERGKKRHISSVHISERVAQKSTCDYGIVPIIEKSMVYENCASQHGKGTDMSINLLAEHLRRHFRRNGFTNKGYIVLTDCHDYFGSMMHERINANLDGMVTDTELVDQTMSFIDPFEKGIGLGSQVCQISAVSYTNPLDHYIKETLRLDMGKYMDDMYVLVDTIEDAHMVLDVIKAKYEEAGLTLNMQKTAIVKLSHGFIWLKKRYYLTESGRVVIKPPREKITRDRQKLKKLARMYYAGETDFHAVMDLMANFKGYMKHLDSYRTKKNMYDLFNELFINDFKIIKGGNNHEQILTA